MRAYFIGLIAGVIIGFGLTVTYITRKPDPTPDARELQPIVVGWRVIDGKVERFVVSFYGRTVENHWMDAVEPSSVYNTKEEADSVLCAQIKAEIEAANVRLREACSR